MHTVLTDDQVISILSTRDYGTRLEGIGMIINNFIINKNTETKMSDLIRRFSHEDYDALQQAALLNRLLNDPNVSRDMFMLFAPVLNFYSKTFFDKSDKIQYDGYNKDYIFDANSNHEKVFDLFYHEKYYSDISFTNRYILETKVITGIKKLAGKIKLTWENIIRELIDTQQYLKIGILMIRKEARIKSLITKHALGQIVRKIDAQEDDEIAFWPICDFDYRYPPDPYYTTMLNNKHVFKEYKLDIVRCRFCFKNDTFDETFNGYNVQSSVLHFLPGNAGNVMKIIFQEYMIRKRNEAIEAYRLGTGKIDLQDLVFFTSDPEKISQYSVTDFLTLVN